MDGNTTISIALIISVSSILMTFLSFRRGTKKDTKEDMEGKLKDKEVEIENRLKVNVKLDQLCSTTNAILGDVKDINKSVQSLNERMATVEASTKNAHHRIDEHLGAENGILDKI